MTRSLVATAMILVGVAPALLAQGPTERQEFYRRYGGPPVAIPPETPMGESTVRQYPSLSGIVNEVEERHVTENQIRDAAVAFSAYRYLFTGSTQFWMDHDRSAIPKKRYAMGDALWTSIHPPDEFGPGGYMYSLAAAVPGTPVLPATLLAPPAPFPAMMDFGLPGLAAGPGAPVATVRTVPAPPLAALRASRPRTNPAWSPAPIRRSLAPSVAQSRPEP